MLKFLQVQSGDNGVCLMHCPYESQHVDQLGRSFRPVSENLLPVYASLPFQRVPPPSTPQMGFHFN